MKAAPCIERERERERERDQEWLGTKHANHIEHPNWQSLYYPGQKKKKNHRWPRFAARRTLFDPVISCSITQWSAQGKVIRDYPPLLLCANCAWSSMISHDGTAFFSPRISGMVLFFFVQGSTVLRRYSLYEVQQCISTYMWECRPSPLQPHTVSFKAQPIDHLRNDVIQHTRTPFPTIPGSNCMGTFRWIGREGR